MWYHMDCFFKKIKSADIQSIKGFEDLRWDDQEKIRNKIDGKSTNDSSKKNNSSLLKKNRI